MNLQLGADAARFREDVRAFLRASLTPELRRGQLMTTGIYPEPAISGAWQRALHARGWLAPTWPPEWGGTGWTPLFRFIFETECALADAPLVHPMGIRLVAPVILRFGTEEQKRQHLPRILSGEDYWCQGFSEPGAGSDLAALRMRALSDGEDYVLNGSKIWTTHAHHANRMFALVRTGTERKPQRGITFLLIDMASPGITVRPIKTIGGDHDVNEVFFQDVRVPQSNRIGEEGGGWECAKYLLEFERGAGIFSPRLRAQLKRVGVAIEAIQAIGHATSPRIESRFGEVSSDLDSFEMLELRTLAASKPNQAPGPIASVVKLRASRLRQSIAELGVEALGLEGTRCPTRHPQDSTPDETRDAVLAMLPDFLNSRAYTIFGGAAEVQLGIIARSFCLAET